MSNTAAVPMTIPAPDVAIVIVTHNSQGDLATCLAAASSQTGVISEIVVVDNASTDDSVTVASQFASVRVIKQTENVGFAAGANLGISGTSARYVLVLNPDCRLDERFASVLRDRLDQSPVIGSASGRLIRAVGSNLAATDTIDSTGIRFTRSGRHFDRGAGEAATRKYLTEDEIAGPSGAAGFYRRAALEQCRISTGYFDSDFFVYREDADLAWRLSNCGWRSVYVPSALAFHRRRNLPERRREMPRVINYHSVKNRFLLRINNQSVRDAILTAPFTISRDVVVVAACLTVERESLPALKWLWINRSRLLAKRRELGAMCPRRSVASEHSAKWSKT
jgi:GT2 family glycosyltransferase